MTGTMVHLKRKGFFFFFFLRIYILFLRMYVFFLRMYVDFENNQRGMGSLKIITRLP